MAMMGNSAGTEAILDQRSIATARIIMGTIKKALLEFLIIGAVGVAVGLTANSVRGSGLRLTKNYFDRSGLAPIQPAAASSTEGAAEAVPDDSEGREAPAPDQGEAHPSHPYKVVDLSEVAAILEDPNTKIGLNVFVDARNDEAFENGHIPGAVQFDHFHMENHLDAVLIAVQAAEKIVVYCNGGDCEDSIFVCADLVGLGVPFDSLYLFAEGWAAWSAGDMPVETGRRE